MPRAACQPAALSRTPATTCISAGRHLALTRNVAHPVVPEMSVGAENAVTSCDLHVLVQSTAAVRAESAYPSTVWRGRFVRARVGGERSGRTWRGVPRARVDQDDSCGIHHRDPRSDSDPSQFDGALDHAG